MELENLRTEIDKIDDQLVRLLEQRMDVACEIGKYKKEHGLKALDPARERQKLAEMVSKSRDDMHSSTSFLRSALRAQPHCIRTACCFQNQSLPMR